MNKIEKMEYNDALSDYKDGLLEYEEFIAMWQEKAENDNELSSLLMKQKWSYDLKKAEKKEREKRRKKEKLAFLLKLCIPIALAVVIIGIIVGVVIGKVNEKNMRSSDNVVISVVDKTQRINGSKYVTSIEYRIENKSSLVVMAIEGDIEIYDGSNFVSSGRFSVNTSISAESSENINLEYSGLTDVYKELYNITYSNLSIKLKITSITFREPDVAYGQPKYYDDAVMKTIKEAS